MTAPQSTPTRLAPAEERVLELRREGLGPTESAARLGYVWPQTVNTILTRLKKKGVALPPVKRGLPPRDLTAAERILLGVIEGAVRAGRPAPTSAELAHAAGMETPQHAFRAMHRMAARGLLRFEGDSGARVITLADGRSTAPVVTREAWAARRQREQEREARPTNQRKRRPCLRCGQTFLSLGAHNRICGPCKHGDAWAPVEHAVVGVRI